MSPSIFPSRLPGSPAPETRGKGSVGFLQFPPLQALGSFRSVPMNPSRQLPALGGQRTSHEEGLSAERDSPPFNSCRKTKKGQIIFSLHSFRCSHPTRLTVSSRPLASAQIRDLSQIRIPTPANRPFGLTPRGNRSKGQMYYSGL